MAFEIVHRNSVVVSRVIVLISLLIILATSTIADEKTEAFTLQQESKEAVQELTDAGIKTRKMQFHLDEATKAFENNNYAELRTQHAKIMIERNTAFAAIDKMRIIEDLISSGEQHLLGMRNSKNTLILAKSALEREDFATALERASQAETTAQVELKPVPFAYVLYNYWWLLAIGAGACVILARKTYYVIITSNLSRKIRDLTTEEMNIIHLMKEAQELHFKKKELSSAQFHKRMYDSMHRLSQIRRERARLRAERVKLYSVERELEWLQQEEKDTYTLIKKAQEDHFVLGITGENEYHMIMGELHERLAEIEESVSKLQYVQVHEAAIKRIEQKRRAVKQNFLDKTIDTIIIPESEVKKQQTYSDLKKAYEKEEKERLREHKIERTRAPTKEQTAKTGALDKLKNAYKQKKEETKLEKEEHTTEHIKVKEKTAKTSALEELKKAYENGGTK